MKEQINHGKGFLKEKLGDFRVDPPEKVWNSIAAQLGGRSRRGMIIVTLSAAATIAIAVALGINFFGPDITSDSITQADPGSVPDAAPGTIGAVDGSPGNGSVTPGTGRTSREADAGSIPRPLAETGTKAARATLEERVVRTMREISEESAGVTLAVVEPEKPVTEQIQDPDMNQVMGRTDPEGSQGAIMPNERLSEEPGMIGEGSAEETPDREMAGPEEAEVVPVDQSAAENKVVTDQLPPVEEERKRDPRWMVGAALSPLYSYRDAESSAMEGSPDHESGLISYAAGVNVAFRPVSRLAIESGIFFNKMGISIGSPGIQLASRSFDFAPLGAEVLSSNVVAISNSVGNIVTKSGDIYVNSYKLNAEYADNSVTDELNTEVYADQGIRQHLDYLEVPFNLRYTIIDRGIEVQLVGGMSTNLLVNSFVTMETSSGQTDIGYLTNIRNVNYSGNAGMGMIYHIQDHFSLRLEPRFRYFLNSINDASLPTTRPYAFGIFTGLSYRF